MARTAAAWSHRSALDRDLGPARLSNGLDDSPISRVRPLCHPLVFVDVSVALSGSDIPQWAFARLGCEPICHASAPHRGIGNVADDAGRRAGVCLRPMARVAGALAWPDDRLIAGFCIALRQPVLLPAWPGALFLARFRF